MEGILQQAKRRRKGRRMGEPRVVSREEVEGLDLDIRVELIRALIPLGLLGVHEMLKGELEGLAGARYARKAGGPRRHGSNPGSVRLAGQWVPVRVPRVRGERGEVSLRSYRALRERDGAVDERLLRGVLYGLSCRNYERAALEVPGALGLAKSSVSRAFVEASAARLRAFQERDLSGEDFVVLFLDGKSFAEDEMVIALGVTMGGEKRLLGFVQSETENSKVLAPFLRGLLERGLNIAEGVLVVVDGGKGLRKAVELVFNRGGKRALVQRCQWHKRENVVRPLPKGEQALWRRRLARAWGRPTYGEARAALLRLRRELEERNLSAAASLEEGFEETLTLHRLGVFPLLGVSLKSTNVIESVLSQVEGYCVKVDAWRNSGHKHRWLAASLLEIEPRLRRIRGYRHLPRLREALQRELEIEGERKASREAA
ncbi:MAG: transposase [Nitrospinota bacterium]